MIPIVLARPMVDIPLFLPPFVWEQWREKHLNCVYMWGEKPKTTNKKQVDKWEAGTGYLPNNSFWGLFHLFLSLARFGLVLNLSKGCPDGDRMQISFFLGTSCCFLFFLSFFFVIKKRLQKEGEMSYPHTPKAYKKKVHNQ